MEMLLKKAVTGDAEAQFRLALRYLAGEGAPFSLSEGVRWLESATRAEHTHARALLSRLREAISNTIAAEGGYRKQASPGENDGTCEKRAADLPP